MKPGHAVPLSAFCANVTKCSRKPNCMGEEIKSRWIQKTPPSVRPRSFCLSVF